MSFINYSSREINCKIVYYGPGLCGKTTNLQYIYAKTNPEAKGKMISLATETERTLFFDFLPVHLGELSGFKTRFLLYTVPGQVKYASTRKLVLKGADGVVFVADSMRVRHEQNIESLKDLAQNLKDYGINIFHFPLVMQYNKRDLADAGVPLMPVEEMNQLYNRQLKSPHFAGSATTGMGVNDTFKAALVHTLRSIKKQAGW
jgi:hypothetical protein